MKIFLIIIDGLGDKPIPQLGNKTPLEKAKTPNLDLLAKDGICGLILPWTQKGKLPTSDDCHLALFGYSPEKSNPGRGVFEVLGIGEKILKNDICFRGNFATINKNSIIIDRRAERIEETESLIFALNKIKIEGIKILIKKAFGYRVGIILRGKNLSEKVTSNDPKKIGVKVLKISGKEKKAKLTADILNEFLEKAQVILENHKLNKKRKKQGKLPGNYLLVRGAGKLKKVKSFQEKYGLKSAFISGGTLYQGIAKYLGMKEIKVKGADGSVKTDLKGKFLAGKKALCNYDFVFLHIKAADSLAEDGNFKEKKKFIEKIDQNLKFLPKDSLIIITADHSTCSLQKRHCLEPIPILISGKEKDRVGQFSEKACRKGKLGKFKQLELMPKILNLIKNNKK